MSVGNDSGARFLAMAGLNLRKKLRRVYGSPEAAEAAIRKAMASEAQKSIEQWATIAQKRAFEQEKHRARAEGTPFYFSPGVDLRPDESWSFDNLPTSLKETALACMAAAMLVWEDETIREVPA